MRPRDRETLVPTNQALMSRAATLPLLLPNIVQHKQPSTHSALDQSRHYNKKSIRSVDATFFPDSKISLTLGVEELPSRERTSGDTIEPEARGSSAVSTLDLSRTPVPHREPHRMPAPSFQHRRQRMVKSVVRARIGEKGSLFTNESSAQRSPTAGQIRLICSNEATCHNTHRW